VKRIVASFLACSIVGCACAFACAACGDALGLHDLSQTRPGEPTVGNGGEDADVQDGAAWGDAAVASAPALDPSPASAPAVDPAAASQSGAMAVEVDDASPAAPQPGSDTPTANPPSIDAVGTSPTPAKDPAKDAGACPCASGCTVHSNGLGQTYEDCAPAGTYNQREAQEACSAFAGNSASCTIQSCSSGGGGGPGKASLDPTLEQAVCSTGATTCSCWTFSGENAGLVQSTKSNKCDPCGRGRPGWN
jgi:hypothetical protein